MNAIKSFACLIFNKSLQGTHVIQQFVFHLVLCFDNITVFIQIDLIQFFSL